MGAMMLQPRCTVSGGLSRTAQIVSELVRYHDGVCDGADRDLLGCFGEKNLFTERHGESNLKGDAPPHVTAVSDDVEARRTTNFRQKLVDDLVHDAFILRRGRIDAFKSGRMRRDPRSPQGAGDISHGGEETSARADRHYGSVHQDLMKDGGAPWVK